MTNLHVTIIDDDNAARHVLLNAGMLVLLDPRHAPAGTNFCVYWRTHRNGFHVFGLHRWGHAGGDNGYSAIVVKAEAMTAEEFAQTVREFVRDSGVRPVQVLSDEEALAFERKVVDGN